MGLDKSVPIHVPQAPSLSLVDNSCLYSWLSQSQKTSVLLEAGLGRCFPSTPWLDEAQVKKWWQTRWPSTQPSG